MYFISVLFSIPSGGARTKKNTQLCTQSENRFAFKIPSLVYTETVLLTVQIEVNILLLSFVF